jgi:hypothetical protein
MSTIAYDDGEPDKLSLFSAPMNDLTDKYAPAVKLAVSKIPLRYADEPAIAATPPTKAGATATKLGLNQRTLPAEIGLIE